MKRYLLITFLMMGMFGLTPGGIFAQEAGGKGTALSQVVRLNRAPVNKEVLRVQLPRPRETKLTNGLTVLVLERHKLPTVAFSLWIKTGALADPKDLPGLAMATAEMLREGTAHRTSAQLASDIDSIGASLSASAEFGSGTSTVSASGLVNSVERLLDLMSDVVVNPTFPGEEFEIYRKRQLAQLDEQRSDPDFLARERLYRVLYRDFPAAVVSATPESMKAMTPAEFKEFHDRYYVPNNAILGVVGDVQYDEILPLIQKYFGGWKYKPVEAPAISKLPPPEPFRITLVNRPNSVQTNILAGDFAVRRADPDYIPLVVMNHILGSGASSRLFLNLRENKGYTYGAYSYFTAEEYPGAWMAQTEVRNSVTDGSMHELMAEFKRIRNEKVPEGELDEARRSIVARFALSLEQPSTLLNAWLTVNYYGLPENYWDHYPEQVHNIDAGVIERTAMKYVDLDHLQFVCVGDGSQIKHTLEKYGPVQEYDIDGKRLD